MISQINSSSINKLEVIIPNRTNKLLVAILLLFLFQTILGIYVIIIDASFNLSFIIGPILILYLIIKSLFWQFKGLQKLIVNKKQISFIRTSPILSKSKIFYVNEINYVKLKIRTNLDVPIVLFWLKIINKNVILLSTDFKDINTLSGISVNEANIILKKINGIIGKNVDVIVDTTHQAKPRQKVSKDGTFR